MTTVVNRVNGNESYDYTQLKRPNATDRSGDGEQFSLAYQRAQEKTGDKDKRDKAEDSGAVGANAQRTVMQGGVRLELSGSEKTITDSKNDNIQRAQSSGQGLIDTVREWVVAFARSIKELLYKIWNGSASQEDTARQEDVSVQDETVEKAEPERLSEEYIAQKNLETLQNPETVARERLEREAEKNKEIQRLLRTGNMEQVLNYVTENGQKTMAKNSTLLTYYDRTGKIMPLSASDQERILHGDRNTRKL